MIKIIVDCLGGDHSPDANIEGSLLALERLPELSIILTGDEEVIKSKLSALHYTGDKISIVHAPEEISGNDKPTEAIRHKKESSMIKGIRLLHDCDDINGIVSVGSTGALVAAATIRIGRLPCVRRPAFCPILPAMTGGIVGVCDSGANVDCVPEHLVQFALMGSLYLSNTYNIKNPRVALLNIGTEAEKGDTLRKETYKILESLKEINFVGNMESRDLLSGKYDLVVCDGFSGNVLIKSTEGACLEMLKKLKKDISSKLIYKIGALLMYKMFMEEKAFMNYQNYGGSVLLGTEKTIVKGHGSSKKESIAKCIEQAYRMEESKLNTQIANSFIKLFPEN